LRFKIVLTFFLCSSFAAAQSNLWQHVSAVYSPPKLASASISDSQHEAIARLIRQQSKSAVWDCDGDELNAMLEGLRFEEIPLSPGQKVLLLEAGAGCARGGQGSNGAMWLILFRGRYPVILASSEGGFSGWLYSIQPTSSHGFHDLVLGWHMSAFEADLSYFRFDGKSYHAIGSAALLGDGGGGTGRIVPTPRKASSR